MRKFILAFFLSVLATKSISSSFSCIGMESSEFNSKTWKVLLDFDTDVLFINGDKFDIVKRNHDKKYPTVYTRHFTDSIGRRVFDAVAYIEGETYLAQYYAKTGKLISSIPLSCHQLS